MNAGIEFLHKLLEHDPRRRMTPAKALQHSWLESQAETQRARMLQREQSLLAAAQKDEADMQAVASTRGKKRKAGVVELGRSLSTMSVGEDDEAPVAKRARHGHVDSTETISGDPSALPPVVGESVSRTTAWSTFDVDSEGVPGLGLWRGS